MKLIYETTGAEVKIGDTPTITRGGVVLQGIIGTVTGIEEPRRPGKPGRVYMRIAPIPSGVPLTPEQLAIEAAEEQRSDFYAPAEIGAVWR